MKYSSRTLFRAPQALTLGSLVLVALTGSGCSESKTTDSGGDAGDAGGIRINLDGAIPVADAAVNADGQAVSPDGAAADAGTDIPGSGEVGAACVDDAACGDGVCLSDADFGFPGGYCSAQCAGDEDCGADGVCVQVSQQEAICLDACDPSTGGARTCRPGYGCSLQLFVCLPGCTDDTDCPDGRSCAPAGGQSGAGRCFDPSAAVGDPCAGQDDCSDAAFCISEAEAGYPGGTCIGGPCDVASNTGCDANAQCLPTQRGDAICVESCAENTDCRPGYECTATDGFPDRRYCAPLCTADDQCGEGRVCNRALGLCDLPFDPDELGNVCSSEEDSCLGGACLFEFRSGFPGSYCAYSGCNDETPCPGDGVCAETTGGGGICLEPCTMDGSCPREGYACEPVDSDEPMSLSACLPACSDDGQCANMGFTCNDGTGLCTEPFVPANLGAPCTFTRRDCPGGECLREDQGFPMGLCVSLGCRLSGDGPSEPCPTASVCVDDESGDPELGICVPSCAPGGMMAECRPGYECRVAPGNDGMVHACLPPEA